jgi:hypothetical protein
MALQTTAARQIYNQATIPYTAGGTISVGQLVKRSGANAVVVTAAATDVPVGVAVSNATSGETVQVASPGSAVPVLLAGNVNLGDPIGPSATAGQGQVAAPGAGVNQVIIGMAVEDGTSGSSAVVAICPSRIQG